MVRFRVRRYQAIWEVWVRADGADRWQFSVAFPAWWQAMLHVTGELPYGSETGWTPELRPLWCD